MTVLLTSAPDASTSARAVASPIGELLLVASAEALVAVRFSPFEVGGSARAEPGEHPVLDAAATQMGEWFAGERTEFDLPLAPHGTEYQLRVWEALLRVPYGSTATYADIARELGQQPGASRAVGLANGRNPIPVVIPCHRVIGSNGTLTGYAGGLERKQVLLDLEQTEGDRLF